MLDLEEVSIAKLGIIGVVIAAASRVIYALWSYGEKKADKALAERDALREERTELRKAHELEILAKQRTHEAEIARMRLECQEQINEVRTHAMEKMETQTRDVTKFVATFEPMLQKLSDRLQAQSSKVR